LFKKKSFWLMLAVVIFFLAFMKYSSGNRAEITSIERTIRDSFTPLQSGLSGLRRGLSGVSLGLAEKKELKEKFNDLTIEDRRLKQENEQLMEYKAETERLRSLLAFKEQNSEQYTLQAGRVIARSPNNWFKVITIDQGSQDGITQGMPVINPDGLVGRVMNTSKYSSQVELITDREMAVGAILQNTRETRGIIEGRGDSDTLGMINIPYYSQVKKGERVISSGLSEFYPKGITIGTIKSVKREANGLLLTAAVKPAVKFDELEEVFVITQFRSLPEEKANKGE
jgi:rod shape-determining protein MreC